MKRLSIYYLFEGGLSIAFSIILQQKEFMSKDESLRIFKPRIHKNTRSILEKVLGEKLT